MYKLLDSVYTITFDASFTISRQSIKIIGYNTKYLTNSILFYHYLCGQNISNIIIK